MINIKICEISVWLNMAKTLIRIKGTVSREICFNYYYYLYLQPQQKESTIWFNKNTITDDVGPVAHLGEKEKIAQLLFPNHIGGHTNE